MISSTAPKTSFGANVRRTVVPRQAVKPIAAQGDNKVASTFLAGLAAVTLMVAPVQAATGIVPETKGFPVNVGVSDSDKSALQNTEKTRDVVSEQLNKASSGAKEGAQNLGDAIKSKLPNSLVSGTIGSGGDLAQRAGDRLKDITSERVNQAGQIGEEIVDEIKNVPADVGSQSQNLGDKVGDAVKGGLPNQLISGNIGGANLDTQVQQGAERAKSAVKNATGGKLDQAGRQADRLGDAASNTASDVGLQAQSLGDRVSDAVKSALPGNLVSGNLGGSNVQQNAERAKDATGDKLDQAGREADKLSNQAGRQVEKAKSGVEDFADKAKQALKPAALNTPDLGRKVQQAAEQAKNEAGRQLDNAGKQVDKVANKAGNQADKLANKAGSQAENVKAEAEKAVKSVRL